MANSSNEVPHFFVPNRNIESEIDFNQYLYMTTRTIGGQIDVNLVVAETIKDIVSSPESPWEESLQDMVMVGEGGTMEPAFLPHFVDMIGKVKSLRRVFETLTNYSLPYEGMTDVVPQMLKGLVDPKPKLKFKGPIYEIGPNPVELRLDCYTDGLAIYELRIPMAEFALVVTKGYKGVKDSDPVRFNGVRISPLFEGVWQYLPINASVIVWNVRHAVRPSFKDNLTKLIELHSPIAILLTESRMHKGSFCRLDESLDIDMDWGLDDSVGLMGGSVLVWGKNRVKGKVMVSGVAEEEMRMLATVKPLDAPDDPSSPKDDVGERGNGDEGSPEI